MQPIEIPRTNSNDDTCILLEWRCENGQEVYAEDILACLETSKATEDLVSPGAGILYQLAQAGEEYSPGSCIGYLFANEAERHTFLAGERVQVNAHPSSFILTQDAQELVTRYGITEAQLSSLGKRLVKKTDVNLLLNSRPPHTQDIQSSQTDHNQAIIAKRVMLAYQTIPHAFAAIKVYTDNISKMIAKYIEKEQIIVGLVEVLLKELGDMQKDYPTFYQAAEQGTEDALRDTEHAGVGITIDIGTGLYIPVIKRPATKTLGEIAEEMIEFRLKALRRAFKEEDLTGGHITLSLHTDQDIVAAIPIIFPTQRCILSLCSEQEEIYIDRSGNVASRHYLSIGVAYDHRVINGAEAMRFLREIKRRFEQSEEQMTGA
jgi:2-oxoglutarate dehydrogenase E2 component (dihydrolipoamide succinyltransferase)